MVQADLAGGAMPELFGNKLRFQYFLKK